MKVFFFLNTAPHFPPGKESLGELHFGSWSQYQIHDFPKQLVATHTSALDLSWMGITRIGPPLAPPCTCPWPCVLPYT